MARVKGRNIYLIGPMGAGKSEVGRRLAKALGRSFVDTDAQVERRAKLPIHRIFAEKGERAFRRLERRAVARARLKKDAVVALGGGAAADPGEMERLKAGGVVIGLTCRQRELWRRLKASRNIRPLLTALTARESRRLLAQVLRRRRLVYAAADWSISTTRLSCPQAARRIEARLRKNA